MISSVHLRSAWQHRPTAGDFLPLLRANKHSKALAFFVRTPDWHYVRELDRDEKLYVIERDQLEKNDVAQLNSAAVTEFRRTIRSWVARMRGGAEDAPTR